MSKNNYNVAMVCVLGYFWVVKSLFPQVIDKNVACNITFLGSISHHSLNAPWEYILGV